MQTAWPESTMENGTDGDGILLSLSSTFRYQVFGKKKLLEMESCFQLPQPLPQGVDLRRACHGAGKGCEEGKPWIAPPGQVLTILRAPV